MSISNYLNKLSKKNLHMKTKTKKVIFTNNKANPEITLEYKKYFLFLEKIDGELLWKYRNFLTFMRI